MNFNRCVRCGCFFASDDNVCPNCKSKDEVDKNSLKNFLSNNTMPTNIDSLASLSGISSKNISRYLQEEDFQKFKNVEL